MATVVLVGRPNTGKSTLFNRLVGGRVAITLREPGITRDRIIRTAEWLGRRFQVIDTGGLVPGSEDKISRQIGLQVAIALEEADVVVLVTDGREGLVPLDEEVADRLRRGGKRFLVAVNKRDVKKEFDTSEFHATGGEQVFSISAEHGIGVDELLDAIIKRLPEADSKTERHAVSLAILGRPNVGKSSFLNSLLGDERAIVTDIPGTTRDVVEEKFTLENRTYRLLDTAGIRKHAKVQDAVEYYSVSRAMDVVRDCDVVLLMTDITEGPTRQDKKLAGMIAEHGKGLVFVGNKRDLVPSGLESKVQDWATDQLEFVGFVPIVYTSALLNQGVVDAVRRAGQVYDAGGRQLGKAVLRTAVVDKVQDRPPSFRTKVLAMAQVGTRPPVFRVKLSRKEQLSPAYERFLASAVRDCFGFEGYPVRLRVGG
ncbi:MAG: ribosome biogenesis GTPase Der [candidate division WOR-3 bacterium]|nr:MAG: ribosome biogenesis GTPase Der [candidate division WOR-3 bacterium]